MFYGYKPQQRIAIVLSLLLFGFSHVAFALGLSDINVYSNLGEPLRANVNVLGAQDLGGQSCISLGQGSDLRQVNLNLGPISGNTARIAITTNQVINEPIVNLSINVGCGSSIQRSYVLLLDPPLSNNNTLTQTNQRLNDAIPPLQQQAATQPSARNASSTAVTTTSRATEQARPAKKKKAKRSTKKRSQTAKASTTSKASKRPATPRQTKTPSNNDASETSDGQPRLSISGAGLSPSFNDTGLRLEKTLNLSPNAYQTPIVDPEEILMEDELTVMNNRLAHLQKQIEVLQTQNLKLSSDNELKTAQLKNNNKPQKTTFNILLLIIAILLLILAYILFRWLRRRQLDKQENSTKSIWTISNEPKTDTVAVPVVTAENDDDDETEDNPVEEDINKEEKEEDNDLLPPAPISGVFKPDEDEQLVVEDEQAFSVLDHADVFLFHGRANLAIKLLQEFLIDHPKQSVTIWLFLLDLLAKENLEEQYEETATDCKLHYNIKIPTFSESDTETIESLEDFPRLADGLSDVWNTPNALTYLDDLIYNRRPEPRSGLPKNLIEELVLLRAIAEENLNPDDLPQLDAQKLAEIEEKEALLENRKQEKLAQIAEAEKEEKEKEEAEKNETSFEFTLVDK